MMSISFHQFKEHVVIPTLKYLDSEIPYSDEAVDLLMLTCGHESKGGRFLTQSGGGPARGVYQMELATHDDIWDNFIKYRKGGGLSYFLNSTSGESTPADSLIMNLSYATAMARVHYWRVKEPLPSKDDMGYLDKLGKYAKLYYNTHEGKATASKYTTDYLEWRDS
jgi:hypothetical protein